MLERLERALLAFMLGLTSPVTESPHGQELVDANTALAADITGAAKARLLGWIAQELARAAEEGEIDLAAAGVGSDELARMILSAADGFKHAEVPVARDLPAPARALHAPAGPRAGAGADRFFPSPSERRAAAIKHKALRTEDA